MTDHYLIETLQAQGFEVKAPEGFDASTLDAVIENAPTLEGMRAGLQRTKDENTALKNERDENARQADLAKREKLEAEGKFQELRELDREELSNLQSSLVTQRAETLNQSTLSLFDEDLDLISSSLEKHIKPKFENGQVVDLFEFNGNQYSNAKDYQAAIIAHPSFAKKIKTPASSGAQPSGGQGQHSVTPHRSKMNATEKRAYQQEHGQAAYLKLPK